MGLQGAGLEGLLGKACLGEETRRTATSAIGARAGSYGCRFTSTGGFQNRYKKQAWQAGAAPIRSAQILWSTGMSDSEPIRLQVITGQANTGLQQRLSDQLEALSRVGESLTLRLLDLEERLSAVEAHLSEPEGSNSEGHQSALTLLTTTDERIARLEELLEAGRSQAGLEPPHDSALSA